MKPVLQKSADGREELCVSTEMINKVIPCVVKAETLRQWGYVPHAKVRAGFWWLYTDVKPMLGALADKIDKARSTLP